MRLTLYRILGVKKLSFDFSQAYIKFELGAKLAFKYEKSKEPQKLLYLSGAPTVATTRGATSGGPRSHVLGIISAFKKRNWEVTEFIYGNRFEKRISIRSPEKKMHQSWILRLAADLFRIGIGLVNRERVSSMSTPFDLCYERFAAFQALGAGLRKSKKILWILETNGLFYFEAKKDRKSIVLSQVCRFLEERAYRKCDYLVVISETLKIMICESLRLPPQKIIVVPNGVNADFFKPKTLDTSKESNKFTIGFVGSLIDWCGLKTLLEALLQIKKESEIPIEAIIVGDGISKNKFIKMAAELGLESLITFLGHRPFDEVPFLIEEFDICFSGQIQTQSGEMYHSPLKLYEYLSMGKPVIASSFDDARNLIQEGYNGFLFDAGDSEALRNKLLEAYQIWINGGFDSVGIRKKIVDNHTWDSRLDYLLREISHRESLKNP